MRTLLLWMIPLCLAAILYTLYAKKARKGGYDDREAENGDTIPPIVFPLIASAIALVGGFILMGIVSAIWIEVGPAQTMAIYDPFGGGIQKHDYAEGWRIVPLWSQKRFFSTRLQEYTMSAKTTEGKVKNDDSMACQTKEGQSVKVDASLLYRIPKGQAHQLWSSVGADFENIIVRPSARNTVYAVVSQYGIMELYSNAPTYYLGKPGIDFFIGKRKAIEEEIEKGTEAAITAKGLEMEMFLLRDVEYDGDVVRNSIIQKQIAQQDVITQSFQADAADIHSQADQIRALGDKEAYELKAKALAINQKTTKLIWIEGLNPEQVIVLPDRVVPLMQLPGNGAAGAK